MEVVGSREEGYTGCCLPVVWFREAYLWSAMTVHLCNPNCCGNSERVLGLKDKQLLKKVHLLETSALYGSAIYTDFFSGCR